MTISEAFSCLGIPIAKNVASIKEAYQRALPLHHPEEDPEGFMMLHEAYKTALSFAQGTSHGAETSARQTVWQPEHVPLSEEETSYDDLFASLDEKPTGDLQQPKKDFSRKLLRLRLHWLPVSRKYWTSFFSSEAFLLCRNEAACLEKLYELLEEKIHSYDAFQFLLSRLWELESWQRSESLESAANRTRKCISQLHKQYSHYRKMDSDKQISRRIFPALWYYQALPFFFKLITSTFLLPLLSFGSDGMLTALILVFYIFEIIISGRKKTRELGRFSAGYRKRKGIMFRKNTFGEDLLFIGTIFAVAIHLSCCLTFFENIWG